MKIYNVTLLQFHSVHNCQAQERVSGNYSMMEIVRIAQIGNSLTVKLMVELFPIF